jgi:hypothetical protein
MDPKAGLLLDTVVQLIAVFHQYLGLALLCEPPLIAYRFVVRLHLLMSLSHVWLHRVSLRVRNPAWTLVALGREMERSIMVTVL